MILWLILLVCLAMSVFLFIKHKQNQREINRRERLEEKQEQMMELLRNRKKD